MSQENAGRDVLDRLFVRAPSLVQLLTGGVRRLPSGTSLRRRLISLQVQRGFRAMARSDVEVVRLAYEPDAEVWMRTMAGVGLSECYHGREGVRAVYAEVDEAFADWRWTIRAIVDGGDRLAIRGDFRGYGRSSGAETEVINGGTAIKLSERGLIAWQEWFVEQDGWKRALETVGLSE